MENIIIIFIVVAIVSSISVYIYRSKKKGAHCIGCPDAKHCDKCRK